jgi:hypothetical protein
MLRAACPTRSQNSKPAAGNSFALCLWQSAVSMQALAVRGRGLERGRSELIAGSRLKRILCLIFSDDRLFDGSAELATDLCLHA